MLKKLKKYLVGEDSETYAVSLVDEPAIEETYVYFKKQDGEKLEVLMDSNEKHLVAGAVLVPDRPIYRNQDGEEFYVEFTKEAIEKMSQDFLKNYRQHNATVQHEEEAPECYMVESWLKSDMQYDKSLALGLNPELPVGTWFSTFRINNVDVWERIKSGELRGFSVEAMISLDEVDFSKVEEKKEEEFEEQTPEPEPTPEPVAEPQPEPQPTHEPQPEPTPEPVAEPKVEEPKSDEPKVDEPKVDEPKPNPLEELIKSLQEEIKALKEGNNALVEQVKSLEKMPSTKPINTNGGNGGGTGVNGDAFAQWRESMKKMF